MSVFKIFSKKLLFLFLLVFSLYSMAVMIPSAAGYGWDRSLTFLAVQFLHGHISLAPANDMPLGDIAPFNGKFYLYFGPFPSILLMPIALFFGKNTPQISIGIFSMVVTFFAVYTISKRFKFQTLDSLFLSLFLVFSTVVFSSSIINISAYQVEVLGVPLVLLALREYFIKKRPLFMGGFMGLALLTRSNLILGVLFFFLEMIRGRLTKKQFALFLLPILASGIIFGIYNFVRYDSFFDTGYSHSIALQSYPISENGKFGYTSPRHIPANLYSFLIKPPEPLLKQDHGFVLRFPYLKASPWGTAIWFTSPLFLALLYKFRKNKYTFSSALTSLFLALPIMMYFSIGFSQFGYRYVLDFLPFLFVILIPCLLPKLTKSDILLITIGVLYNCIFIASLWEIYPPLWIF